MAKQEQPAKSRFGAQLRAWRKERRLSQEECARACGLNRGHLSLLERGYFHPNPQTAAKIANGLGVSVEEIESIAGESRHNYTRSEISDLSDGETFAVTAYVPQEAKAWLRREARKRNRSMSQLVGAMLLKRYYDYQSRQEGTSAG